MRILFYDWALHTIGGGQKFNCKIAEYLSKNHEVEILTLFPVKKEELEKFYSVDLSQIKIISLFQKIQKNPTLLKIKVSSIISNLSSKYDLFFNVDAQETINPKAKYNLMYAHFFEPKWYRPSKNLIDWFKLVGIYLMKTFRKNYAKEYKIYCNSEYTKFWLMNNYAQEDHIMLPLDEVQETLLTDENNKAAISFSRLLWVNDIGDKLPEEHKVVWEDALMSMYPARMDRKITYSHGLTQEVYFALKKSFKEIIKQVLEIE